jgi:putative ABC transport system permease protein
MFTGYFKITFRNLLKHKLHSGINIFGLATGLAVVILLLLYVQQEMRADKYHQNYEQIFRLQAGRGSTLPAPVAELVGANIPEVKNISRTEAFRTSKATLKYENNSFTVNNIIFSEPDFFTIFSFQSIHGDLINSLIKPMSLVLTETEAKRILGDSNPIGKLVRFENKYDLTVTGIIKDLPKNSSLNFTGVVSYSSLKTILGQDFLTSWMSWNYETHVLLSNNQDATLVESKINDMIKDKAPEDRRKMSLSLFPFKSIYFDSSIKDQSRHGNIKSILILSVIGLFILMIAIINFINLSVAKSTIRAREIGVRKVVGSLRINLIRQFLGEAIILCFFALSLAVIFANLIIPKFNSLSDSNISAILLNTLPQLLLFISDTLLLGFLSGIYPAIYLTRFKPVDVLKGDTAKGPKGSFFKKGLIIFQFAISIILIICTLIITQQLSFLTNKDLGFQKENIIYTGFSPEIKEKRESFKLKLLQNPNIKEVAHTGFIPGIGGVQNWGVPFHYKGEEKEAKFIAGFVNDDFINLIGFKITDGRNFSKEIAGDGENSCIINETAVKEFEFENPFEATFSQFFGTERNVVGIVNDFYSKSLHTPIQPLVFYNEPDSYSYICIKINSNNSQNIRETIEYVKSSWEQFSPNFPFDYHFLDQSLGRLYQSEMQFRKIFTYFSILAIVIASLGLLGLASFSTEQRTKEIGIRKVLGASVSSIIFQFSKEFTKWVLISNIIAWPIAWFSMNKWLLNFAYKIDVNILIFLISGLMAFLIALLTVSLQSLKSATTNPANSLRYE